MVRLQNFRLQFKLKLFAQHNLKMASAAPPANAKPALQPVPECVRDVILEVDNFFRDESVLKSYLSSAFSSDGKRTEENGGERSVFSMIENKII